MHEWNRLLPDIQAWNGGQGVDIRGWLFAVARSDVALAYLDLFWPTFIEHGRYVIRSSNGLNTLAAQLEEWEKATGHNRQAIESAMNAIDTMDHFTLNSDEQEAEAAERCKVIAPVMAEMLEAKLRLDFPSRAFRVSLVGVSGSEIPEPISFVLAGR